MTGAAALMRTGDDYEQNARVARLARQISMSENAKWYCAITNPGCQRRAELELYSLGYRTFTPEASGSGRPMRASGRR